MTREVSECTPLQAGAVRRSTRFIWVMAMCAALAASVGAGVAQTFNENPASVTATPEDPCLLNHTCGEETPGAVEELEAYCANLKERGIFWVPECFRFN